MKRESNSKSLLLFGVIDLTHGGSSSVAWAAAPATAPAPSTSLLAAAIRIVARLIGPARHALATQRDMQVMRQQAQREGEAREREREETERQPKRARAQVA